MREAMVDVTIFDTTLRDGAQSLPQDHQFPDGEKPVIASYIAGQGIDVIEAGFPRTEGDKEEVEQTAHLVGNAEYYVDVWQNGEPIDEVLRQPVIAGLSRTTPEDIEVTWEAVRHARRPRIHTFISTDPEHMAAKFPGKSPDEVLDMGRTAVALAKEFTAEHPLATVEFSAEAASTTDTGYLEKVIKSAIDQGADIINVPDTVGQRRPSWMNDFYEQIIGWVHETNGEVTVSAHNHNDLDMAVANSLSLVEEAAIFAARKNTLVKVQVEAALCGLGERAGNTDMYPFMANLFKHSAEFGNVPIRWRFNPGRSVEVANTVMGFAGIEVDRQSPIVGRDTLVHRSGIHSDGVVKGGHRIYTPHDPVFWGHDTNERHEEGKYQGRRGREAIAATNRL